MTHAEDLAAAEEWLEPLLAKLDAIPPCAACGRTRCQHPDPVFLGIIPHHEGTPA